MDLCDYQRSFEQHGFVVVPGFLSPSELAELQGELDRYIREIVPNLPRGDAFYQQEGRPESLKQLQRMGHDPYFDAYRGQPKWTEFAEVMLGESAEATEPEWFNKPPCTEHATPPHQDNHYFQLEPPQVLTMWLALDEVNEENGALRYVKGSHRQGRRPHGATEIVGFSQGILDYSAEDRQAETLVCLNPGDLVAHHGETIHRADPNRSSDRQRRAFAMVFRGASCGVDEVARKEYQATVHAQHQRYGLASKQ